jgi:hypothetical protein
MKELECEIGGHAYRSRTEVGNVVSHINGENQRLPVSPRQARDLPGSQFRPEGVRGLEPPPAIGFKDA